MPSLISAPFTARGPVVELRPPILMGSFGAWAGAAAAAARTATTATAMRSDPVVYPRMSSLLVCPGADRILCPRSAPCRRLPHAGPHDLLGDAAPQRAVVRDAPLPARRRPLPDPRPHAHPQPR